MCAKHSGKRKICSLYPKYSYLFFWRDASITSYVLIFMAIDNRYAYRYVVFPAATGSNTGSSYVQCGPGVLVRRQSLAWINGLRLQPNKFVYTQNCQMLPILVTGLRKDIFWWGRVAKKKLCSFNIILSKWQQ